MARILVVDDKSFFRHLVCKILTHHGYETVPAQSGAEALDILRLESFDLMICDISMSPVDGMELLGIVKESDTKMNVIMLTAQDSITKTVESIKIGAFDYLTKPVKVDVLIQVVRHALEYQAAQSEHINIQDQLEHRDLVETITGPVSRDSDMLSLCHCIEGFAPTDTTVFIYGEEGAGKSFVARSIYRYSHRKRLPLTTVNCLELEGLKREKIPFEITHNGTLFLDEISMLPTFCQTQLLEFFRGNEISSGEGVGHTKKNVRIIVSSSEMLEPLVEQGRLMKDIYRYLADGVVVKLPPLRIRRGDILPIVLHILRQNLGPDAQLPMLDRKTQWALEHYDWPGNVRELKEAVLQAAVVMQDDVVTLNDLPAEIVSAFGEDIFPERGSGSCEKYIGESAKDLLRSKKKDLLQRVVKGENDTV